MAGSLGLELLLGDELLAPELGELELGELELELGELELAPPDAEPDLVLSLEEDGLDGLVELDELDGLDEAPPDGDEDELLGEDDGLDEVLPALSLLQAARLRARTTATAMAESFMCPPGWGLQKQQIARPS